jgi:hypothetical protein
MRYLVVKFGLFILPLIIIPIIETFFLPVNFFNYRTWEALAFMNKNYKSEGPFYPNYQIEMDEEGDLAFHTPQAILKKTQWITDEIGYRNNQFIQNPDILLIGDSFFAGSSLDQSETLNNQLQSKLDSTVSIYTMAPASFKDFHSLYSRSIIHKPKTIIYSIVERNTPEIFGSNNQNKETIQAININHSGFINSIKSYSDRFTRLFFKEWLFAKIHNKKGPGISSNINPSMYFMKGKESNNKNEADLINTVNAIKSYKLFCDKNGIEFIFIPMPNKETVYYDLVPFEEQPNYLFKLDSAMQVHGIKTINPLKIYNEERKTSSELLYKLDDTHWTSKAVNCISKEIISIINKK